MKPDWKNAPDWAQYLAMDENGDWAWFEAKPKAMITFWATDPANDRVALASESPSWEKTLEARP